MPAWARTFVLLVGMAGWMIMMIGMLLTHQPITAALIGFPAGLWIALSGRSNIARKRARKKFDKAPDEPEGGAA